jgi:hypothetical protein
MKNYNISNLELEELKNGFCENEESYQCLVCNRTFEKGLIFREDDQLYDAQRFVRLHIEKAHNSTFAWLVGLDKKENGLSEHQAQLLNLFYQGLNDQQIQQKLKIGSISTVRNHRFSLKEKEKQAKLFLAIMQLLRKRENEPPRFIKPHETATMIDDRYKITSEENEKILKKLFPDGLDGKLKTFAVKQKSKLAVLRHISNRFEIDRLYDEKEVNQILKEVYDDYVMLRRYLIEYGFIDRKTDGSCYWLKKQK